MKKMSILIGVFLLASLINFVNANGPQADFHWTPASPSTADTVQFYDDSDNQANITDRMWYFGDGGGSPQKNPTHTYSRPGTYTVELLVVWNISGNVTADEVEKVITIANQPPVADAGPDQLVNVSTVTLDGSGSHDPDGNIVSWHWKFGDGSTGSGEVVHHTYSNNGEYTVTLNVTDDSGGYDTDTCNVTVDTMPPTTTINVSGNKGNDEWYKSNVTITFHANDNLSGVKETYYRIDNISWNKYTTSITISDEGTHLIEFYSYDNVMNKENVKNKTIKIDRTKPVVKITSPKEKRLYVFGRDILPARKTIVIGKITVTADVSDNISGISNVSFLVDNKEVANFTEPPYEWKWGGQVGLKTLKVVAYDKAGWNESKEREVRIISLFKPWSAEAESL